MTESGFVANSDLLKLDVLNGQWTKFEPSERWPRARFFHDMVAIRCKAYVFGGDTGDGSKSDTGDS